MRIAREVSHGELAVPVRDRDGTTCNVVGDSCEGNHRPVVRSDPDVRTIGHTGRCGISGMDQNLGAIRVGGCIEVRIEMARLSAG
jgi:hypothetical protein